MVRFEPRRRGGTEFFLIDQAAAGVNLRNITFGVKSNNQPSHGDGGDISETETEDSFPMYRKSDKSGDTKDEEEESDDEAPVCL